MGGFIVLIFMMLVPKDMCIFKRVFQITRLVELPSKSLEVIGLSFFHGELSVLVEYFHIQFSRIFNYVKHECGRPVFCHSSLQAEELLCSSSQAPMSMQF